MRLLSSAAVLTAMATVAGCSGSPIAPPPPPPGQLQITCPLPIVREATSPLGADAHFDAPAPSGGRTPYSVECVPGSGSLFAIGESTVRCTATDADTAQASCTFRVTVRVSQALSKSKFLAFGDSMTAGVTSLEPLLLLDATQTYPFKLEQMLLERYPAQPIVVLNRGLSGEDTREGARRLPSVLDADQPEVMLLLEGVNNINGLATTQQASALRTMIVEAQQRGVHVMVATVMPVSPTWRHYQPGNTTEKIQALNERIEALAIEFDLDLVDLYALFEANMHLIGADGLHPTAAGQTRIAEAFRDGIVQRYDGGSSSLETAVRRFTGRSTRLPHFSTMRRIDGR